MGNYINKYTENVKESTSELVSEEVAITAVKIATWIGLFLISKILMIFIRIFADAISNFPIIKQFNKLGRYHIWYLRGICYNIYISCNYKHSLSNDRRKYYK